MFGRAYDFHRHSGRMTQDPSMRMTNKAEVGMALPGLIGLIIIGLIIVGVFL